MVLAASSCSREAMRELVVTPTVQEPTASPRIVTPEPMTTKFETYRSDLGYAAEVPSDWAIVPDFQYPEQSETRQTDLFQSPATDDPDNPTFVANITVGLEPAEGVRWDQFFTQELDYLIETYPGARQEIASLAGSGAYVVYFTKSAEFSDATLDYAMLFTVSDDEIWTLTLTTLAGFRDKYLPIFEHFCGTFGLVPE
jgi:hypothetical protein